MSNLIQADKLIAEIERRREKCADIAADERNEEVAEYYRGKEVAYDETSCLITSLQQEQSFLPSNIDEVADKQAEAIYPKIIREGHVAKHDVNLLTRRGFKKGFKAGAKWMAWQGVTKEAVIGMATEEISINISQETLDELDPCPGDNIVVQIRKK